MIHFMEQTQKVLELYSAKFKILTAVHHPFTTKQKSLFIDNCKLQLRCKLQLHSQI